MKTSRKGVELQLNAPLNEIGFTQCQNEPSLYKQDMLDDLLITCQKKTNLIEIKSMISRKFECVDKDQLQMFLGMQIQRDGNIGDISMPFISKICYNVTACSNVGSQERH